MSLAERVESVTSETPVVDELSNYWTSFTVRSVLAEDVQSFVVGLPTSWFFTSTETEADTETSGDVSEPDSAPWYATAGLEDMELAVARVRHEARAISRAVEFSSPTVQAVAGDDGDEVLFVVLRVFIPTDIDGFEFRDAFFARLADELKPDALARLAVRVATLP